LGDGEFPESLIDVKGTYVWLKFTRFTRTVVEIEPVRAAWSSRLNPGAYQEQGRGRELRQ
jgi:hypothetical protein